MPKLTRKKKEDRSPSPALAAAFELHRQGRLVEAEAGYREILKDDSANWQAPRLFRQPDFGDWQGVIERASRELANFK
jgi:hypothetical protein